MATKTNAVFVPRGELSPDQVNVLNLHYEGFKHREIAEETGYALKSIGSLITRHCQAPCHNPDSPIRNGGPCMGNPCIAGQYPLIPHHLNCPARWNIQQAKFDHRVKGGVRYA